MGMIGVATGVLPARNGQPETAAVPAPLAWATIGVFLLDCALRPGAQWKDRRVG
jgi:hypothetical protein